VNAGGEEDEVGKAFKKELERRQISSVDDLDDPARAGRSRRGGYTPPPSFGGAATDEVPPQLQMSRALNSEGLEGFLPRAAELLKLGLSFFLAFGPFIVAVALAFTAIYAVSVCARSCGAWHWSVVAQWRGSCALFWCRFLASRLCTAAGRRRGLLRTSTQPSC
jgi:hypothetical protein